MELESAEFYLWLVIPQVLVQTIKQTGAVVEFGSGAKHPHLLVAFGAKVLGQTHLWVVREDGLPVKTFHDEVSHAKKLMQNKIKCGRWIS